jgi:hypothetical protein
LPPTRNLQVTLQYAYFTKRRIQAVAALELAGLIALVIVGVIIILLIGAFLFLLPAILIAAIVWFITGSELLTGVAFLLVALISLVKR